MFNKYKIKYENGKEVLYLYFDNNYEFSLEFLNKFNINKINFKGNIIKIVISGIVISTIALNPIKINHKEVVNTDLNSIIMEVLKNSSNIKENEESVKEEKNIIADKNINDNKVITNKNINDNKVITNKISNTNEQTNNVFKKDKDVNQSTNNIVDNTTYVTLKRSNGNIQKIELEEYLIGVVGAEMPASFDIEALKAQAVVARTYTLKKIKNNQVLTDSVNDQVYKNNEELKSMWGGSYNTYYNKIKSAVNSTKGEYITYNGNYIEAVYHSTSNGKTEDSIEVWGNNYSYLKSVDSVWDKSVSSYEKSINMSYLEISSKLGFDIDNTTNIEIISRTGSNRIKTIKINDTYYSGVELRKLLNLRSTDFEIIKYDNNVTIKTYGYGHGVGMSQYGAQGMALNGYNYKEILKYYYNGVSIV